MGTKTNQLTFLRSKKKATADDYHVLIIDTAGRLQIDETLMDEQ